MDLQYDNQENNDPPPPGVDSEEKISSRYENRSNSSKDHDRDRSRHGRNRESRHDHESRYDHDRYDHESRHDHGDKDYRESRSRHRDYDRRNHRDRSRDRDSRDRDRDRGRSRERTRSRYYDGDVDYRDDIPSTSILLRNLPPHVTEDDIRTEVTHFSLYPQNIIIMKRSSGESRRMAVVEFRMLSDAVRWKELTQGVLYFGQIMTTVHYYVLKDVPPERGPKKSDWNCVKCNAVNFGRRDACYKCNTPRDESEICKLGGEGYEEISRNPSSTLLFRNLDILTTEERVLSMLGQITVLPIKNLKVAKDSLTNTSRGFAYVELHSISEAMQLYDLLLSMEGNFYVDGRRITVSYSCRSLTYMNSANNANAASVALAAAQWTNQEAGYSQTAITNQQMASKAPNVSSFQYDERSGYYYDSTTGYYYDANSQYFYNSETQQYLYWDSEKQNYIVVPSNQTATISSSAIIQAPAKVESKTEAVISSPPVISHAPILSNKKDEPKEKINSQDKVKFAKRVAKDMEKWAKTLNQKKENAKMHNNNIINPKPPPEVPIEKMEKKNEEPFYLPLAKDDGIFETEFSATPTLGLVATYGEESDSEQEDLQDEGTKALELLKAEENKLIDWTKLACLLCKRQFGSNEVLTKHVQMSDLHKQNVDMLKLTKLTPKQLQELEKKVSGYRDRAKERRQKFGQPDMPPPSKLKARYLKEKFDSFKAPEPPAEAIGSDNIGNKMLKAMGWSEGQGLGKSGQGMSGIIEVQRRVKSAGLGMQGASYGASASDSYKDAVRKAMQARYNEIA